MTSTAKIRQSTYCLRRREFYSATRYYSKHIDTDCKAPNTVVLVVINELSADQGFKRPYLRSTTYQLQK